MIKALIVEDEVNNRKNLLRLLETYCEGLEIVAIAADADEAISLINKNHPQLVFLDIQMPNKNGFQMLQELGKYDFEIIFVTAYGEYGIKAIKFSAIDYLLKPINIDDLKIAVHKAIEKINGKRENENLKNLLHYLQHSNNKTDHRIAISSVKEIKLVPVSEIVRCESQNTYTLFHLLNNEKVLSTTPIAAYEELLEAYGFIRCHQSHLINKKLVKSFLKKDGYSLLMADNSIVPVSRQKKETVKANLLQL
jgi:two-component system, LytTR family, response regulator